MLYLLQTGVVEPTSPQHNKYFANNNMIRFCFAGIFSISLFRNLFCKRYAKFEPFLCIQRAIPVKDSRERDKGNDSNFVLTFTRPMLKILAKPNKCSHNITIYVIYSA